ncbi:MAG: hypothetical protein Q9223_007285 [Gallowayella weberi]
MVARHGLTEVYTPPKGTNTIALPSSSPTPSNASTNSPTPQKEEGERPEASDCTADSGIFWPRDLLPNVIHDVHVFTWGYDADIDRLGSASQIQYTNTLVACCPILQISVKYPTATSNLFSLLSTA